MRLAFERKAACGDDTTCVGPKEPPLRHILKHANTGLRSGGRDSYPAHFPGFELEGWAIAGMGPKVGFRCVADLAPGDVPLRVPAPRSRSRSSASRATIRSSAASPRPSPRTRRADSAPT
jgi:hypothetical protein